MQDEPVPTGFPVEHEPEAHRFVARSGDLTAELSYERRGDQLVMVHTWVPVELRNRGVAGRLVEEAVRYCRQEDLVAVGACSFARAWLARNAGRFPDLEVR
jgi:predicted GNAT family acetyltransferase